MQLNPKQIVTAKYSSYLSESGRVSHTINIFYVLLTRNVTLQSKTISNHEPLVLYIKHIYKTATTKQRKSLKNQKIHVQSFKKK